MNVLHVNLVNVLHVNFVNVLHVVRSDPRGLMIAKIKSSH